MTKKPSAAPQIHESIRSKNPPCPGKTLLESLSPLWRLSMLSPRSPSGASAPITKPRKAPCNGDIKPPKGCGPSDEKAYEKNAPIATEVNSPAKYPSQLFLGLRRGVILCFP